MHSKSSKRMYQKKKKHTLLIQSKKGLRPNTGLKPHALVIVNGISNAFKIYFTNSHWSL